MEQTFIALLAQCVQFHRKQSGLSRTDLAELAGVGKTVIYDIEHAKSTVQLKSLLRVLSTLNIRVELTSPLMDSFQEQYGA